MKEKDKKYTDPETKEELADEIWDQAMKEAEGEKDNLAENEAKGTDGFEKLQEEYTELNNSYLRLHADFDNYRKRTMKEKADIIKSGGERVLSDIIPLVDDFERALVSIHDAEDKNSMLEGIDLIYAKFASFLQQHGIKEVKAVGEPFDPERFEAVTTIPVDDKSLSGTVVDCIQKGYMLNDKVLRFPKVIVGE